MIEPENNEFLEEKIAHRFDELADKFPQTVGDQDKRVQALLEVFDPIQGKSLLDIGCGKGRFAAKLGKYGAQVRGIEPSQELLKEAQKLKENAFQKGSATHLDFPDESFDGVYCIEVLQHVPDHKRAIEEMVRVVKKGGQIVIIDRNKLCLLRTVWKKYKELRDQWMYPKNFPYKEKTFTPGEIKRQLAKHGLKVQLRYLGENNILEKSGFHRLASSISQGLSTIIPLLSYNIAWIGTKNGS